MPLRLRQRHGIYQLRGAHFGVKIERSLKTRCREEADQLKALVEKQIYEEKILGIRPEQRKPTSFAETAIDYMTAGGEARYLDPLIIAFGDKPIRDLRQADIDRLASTFSTWGHSTRNRQLYVPFIAIMNYGAKNDKCAARTWRKLPEREAATEWITPDEADQIAAAMTEDATRRLFVFYLSTGARAEEGALVKCRQFSPGGQRVTFLGTDEDEHVTAYAGTKAGRTRSIDLPPRMMDCLPDLSRGDQRAFLNRNGKPYAGRGAISKTLRTACTRAGLPEIGPHALRHSFATWHYAVHKDPLRLMREGGWKSTDLIDRYVHAATDDIALAAIRGGWAKPGQHHRMYGEIPSKYRGVK